MVRVEILTDTDAELVTSGSSCHLVGAILSDTVAGGHGQPEDGNRAGHLSYLQSSREMPPEACFGMTRSVLIMKQLKLVWYGMFECSLLIQLLCVLCFKHHIEYRDPTFQ